MDGNTATPCSDNPTVTHGPEQWGRSFLKSYVVPQLAPLTAAAMAEYSECVGAWRLDAAQRAARHDDARFRRLVEIIDDRLRLIMMRYNRRIAFNITRALRSHELLALVPVSGAGPNFFAHALIRASRAIAQHGERQTSVQVGDTTVVQVTVEEMEQLTTGFPRDLARICALAVLRYEAENGHRRAGKGMRLAPATREIHWRFEPDPPLEAAITAYDERAASAPRLGGTHGDGPAEVAWPVLMVCQEPIRVTYPPAGAEYTSWSYLMNVRDVSGRAAQLEGLAEEFRTEYSLDIADFLTICHVLKELVLHRTGWRELDPVYPKRGIVMRSALRKRDKRLATAPGYLYTVMSEGVLRAPRDVWIDMLSGAAGHHAAETFIERFTSGAQHSHLLLPALFHDLEPNSLVLDLLLADEFFDLCRHALLAGRDGETGKAKGKWFEDYARRRLVERLGLDRSRIPIDPNTQLRKLGLGDGEVDFCFLVHTTLVHVQLKSWSRNHAYHRGEFKAVSSRLSKLHKILERNDEYGRKLLTAVPQADSVVTFVCVPAPEYVPPDPFFHLGIVPRVLTPDELADVIESAAKWSQVVPRR